MIIESICSLPDSCKKRIMEKYGIKERKVVAVLHFADTSAELDEHGMVELTKPSSLGFFNKYFWISVTKICCGYNHLVGLRDNGTVVYYGDNTYGQCDVGHWRNVVVLMADKNFTVGITKDRQILEAGEMFAPPKAEPPVQVRNVKKTARKKDPEYMGIPHRRTDVVLEETAPGLEGTEGTVRRLPIAGPPAENSGKADSASPDSTAEKGTASAPVTPEASPAPEGKTEAAPEAKTEKKTEEAAPEPKAGPDTAGAAALAEEAKNLAQAAVAAAAKAAARAVESVKTESVLPAGGAEQGLHISTSSSGKKKPEPAPEEPPMKLNINIRSKYFTGPGGKQPPEEESKPLNSDTGQRLRNGGEQLLRSFAKRISTCTTHTLGVRADGQVFAAGSDHYGQCGISRCRNVRSIAAGNGYSVALFASGNVVSEGMDTFGRCQTERWDHIVGICAGSGCTIGIRQNGTLVTAGRLPAQSGRLRHWTQIVDVSQEEDRIFALTSQGFLLSTDPQIDRLQCTNIAAIDSGRDHTLVLQKTGKVLVLGHKWSEKYQVQGWSDIVAVAAGADHSVGLCRDGRVVAAGKNDYHQCDVGDWTDMIAISAGEKQTVGLKADGSVLTVGAAAD